MVQPAMSFVPSGTAGSMQVAVLEATGKLVIKHGLIPEPSPDEVRVRIQYVGICGSDLEAFRGLRSPEFMATPTRLGHEVAGVLDAVGARVHGLEVGERVTCRYVWGAFAEYIVCKPFNVLTLPRSVPALEVSLIEVLPGIIHAVELARITPHTSVLIMGQGVSGLVMTQVARLHSPRVLAVTDLKPRNLTLGRAYGATHAYRLPHEHASTMEALRADHPGGFEVVIPCLLDGDGMRDALDAVALGGRIILYGCIGTCRDFDFFKMHRKRCEIHSTEPKRDIDMRRYFDEGRRLVTQGLINTSEMVTHVYPLSRVQEAFELRNDKSPEGEAIHVMIDCSAGAAETIVVCPGGGGKAREEEAATAAAAAGAARTCC